MKGRAPVFESEEKRLILFTRFLALFVLLCLAFSWKIWVSREYYPLVPFLGLIPAFPFPLDYFILALFVSALIAVFLRPRSQGGIACVLGLYALLFLQDQNRLWPSFYQYFFLFLILLTYRRRKEKDEAHRILTGMRFVIAAIYFWGGVHKLNTHFFNTSFPDFVRPLTQFLPFEIPFLPVIGVFAALFEVWFGLGLLTKRFRNIALYEAMFMHTLILVCIGPLRGDWNNSSWMWGQTMAAQVWVLFYKAPAFTFGKMFNAPRRYSLPQALAVVLIGVMPLFNNIDLWDAALSFNVYTGNVNYAQIHLRPDVADTLPAALLPYIGKHPDRAVLSLNSWTLHQFNANPYPEERIFKAILAKMCTLVPEDAVYLYLQKKASWFYPKKTVRFGCGEI